MRLPGASTPWVPTSLCGSPDSAWAWAGMAGTVWCATPAAVAISCCARTKRSPVSLSMVDMPNTRLRRRRRSPPCQTICLQPTAPCSVLESPCLTRGAMRACARENWLRSGHRWPGPSRNSIRAPDGFSHVAIGRGKDRKPLAVSWELTNTWTRAQLPPPKRCKSWQERASSWPLRPIQNPFQRWSMAWEATGSC
jgi:hypothetical protein